MLKLSPSCCKPNSWQIYYFKVIRFLLVGQLLHLFAAFGFSVFWIFFEKISEMSSSQIVFWVYLAIGIEGFLIIVFSQFDAYGRYQNYKQIKDALYRNGFDPRLVKPFCRSKCQREAVLTAARDLNHLTEAKEYIYAEGYRFYHILPDDFIEKPLVLFHSLFWKRILFTKYYKLQNFYW